MGAHDFKFNKVPLFFVKKTVNINVFLYAAPKLALVQYIKRSNQTVCAKLH